MDIRNLKGSIVALVTPFHADGSVNFDKLRELTQWHIASGTDAILALGTTGESSTMTHEEDDAVLQTVIAAAAGRVPVIAGTGSNATQTMLEKSLRAAAHHPLLQQGQRRGHLPPLRYGGRCGEDPLHPLQRARAHRLRHLRGECGAAQ